MRFGVVVCKRCRRAKAFEAGAKSTQCPTCGQRLDVTKLRNFYRADDHEALREAVGRINARLAGDPGAFEAISESPPRLGEASARSGEAGLEGESGLAGELAKASSGDDAGAEGQVSLARFDGRHSGDSAPSAGRPAARRGGRAARVEQVARRLSAERGEFSDEEFAEALDAAGLDAAKAEAHLKRLKAGDVLFEPRPGAYRALE